MAGSRRWRSSGYRSLPNQSGGGSRRWGVMQGRQTGSRTGGFADPAERVGAERIWTVGSSRTMVAQLHRLRSVVSSCSEKQRGEIVRERGNRREGKKRRKETTVWRGLVVLVEERTWRHRI